MKRAAISPARAGAVYVLAGATCISFAPLFVRLDDVGPTAVAFYRLLWGGVALAAAAVLRRDRLLPSKPLFLLMVAAAFFFTCDLACWHQSIIYIGPGMATIVTNFQVFILAVTGVVFFKEPMTPRLVISIVMAFAGIWLLVDTNISDMPGEVAAGLLLGLCTASFYSAYILTLRRSQSLMDRLPAVSNMAIISLMGMVFSGILSSLQGQSLIVPSLRSNMLLMLYGFGCQGFGWLLLSKGLPHLPASRAGLLMLLQPSLAFLWDILLCGRSTSISGYAGALITLIAISSGVLGKTLPGKTQHSRT
ncbi:MAG: DMT family transporter [Desulfovibrio sp.]|jgi:drug/metabolite transporter (DMT)-like permease|nr:DMT family transporter [Desulfovibrio sp.]